MGSSLAVARKAKPTIEPIFFASVRYKLWVREQLATKKISLAALKAGIERHQRGASVSTSALSQFLGRKDEAPTASNTELMPGINRTLDAAPPPICDPTDELAQVRDRMAARWATMDKNTKAALLALIAPQDDDA